MSLKNFHTNELLVAHLKKGNQKAFKTLFDEYWEAMFCKANSILRNRDVAQDIVQEIWINLWNQRENLEVSNFEAYIFRSVSYGCYKYLRDIKFNTSQLKVIDSLIFTRSEIENQHNIEATQLIIDKALKELSPRCRQIYKLSRLEDVTNKEIALRLGISKRSVENQVSIALKVIRHHLGYLQTFIFFYLLFFR